MSVPLQHLSRYALTVRESTDSDLEQYQFFEPLTRNNLWSFIIKIYAEFGDNAELFRVLAYRLEKTHNFSLFLTMQNIRDIGLNQCLTDGEKAELFKEPLFVQRIVLFDKLDSTADVEHVLDSLTERLWQDTKNTTPEQMALLAKKPVADFLESASDEEFKTYIQRLIRLIDLRLTTLQGFHPPEEVMKKIESAEKYEIFELKTLEALAKELLDKRTPQMQHWYEYI